MKTVLILLFVVCFKISYSQNIEKTIVKVVTDKSVIKILTSLESYSTIQGKKLTIGVFKISNGSGSAHVKGDDEVSNSYIFTVTDSAGDEYPNFKVFSVGPFYMSKILKTADFGNTYFLTIEHSNSDKRMINKVILSMNKALYK